MSKRAQSWTAPPAELFEVRKGFALAAASTSARPGFAGGKSDGLRSLATHAAELSELQRRLFAMSTQGDRRRVLVVLQAMDAAGKGGIVEHVLGAVSPIGLDYTSFRSPTVEERAHDFLWRVEKAVPAPGHIGVFDRSHYEDVLIGRVRELASEIEIERRYGAINAFERRLVDSGTAVVKIMLNVGRTEQKKRLADRLTRPEKHWKYSPEDVDDRLLWDAFQQAYQVVFERTSTDYAPWFVVPADKKWYSRLAVQRMLIDVLEGMELEWPPANYDIHTERQRIAAS